MRCFMLVFCIFQTSWVHAETFMDWNYDGKASGKGKGCEGRAVEFITAGNEISVIFSKMGIELQPNTTKREVHLSCTIDIPAKVRGGNFVTQLNEQYVYGYVRTEGTQGEIILNTKFEQENAGKIRTQIPTPGYDPLTAPYIPKQVQTNWRVKPSWCTGRDFKTRLVMNLDIRAHRKNTNSSIVVTADGFDTRYDADVVPGRCK